MIFRDFRLISTGLHRFYHSGAAPFAQPHCQHGSQKLAVRDNLGVATYGDIVRRSNKLGRALKSTFGEVPPHGDRNIAFLTENNHHYVLALYGIWKSGFAGVPLCKSHPLDTLRYYTKDSKASALITTRDYADKIGPLRGEIKHLIVIEEVLEDNHGLEEPPTGHATHGEDNALLIYTSGTTGSPKGVVLTMNNVISQIECMIQPWGWTKNDNILHVLPLHHTHGIVNCLLCPLQVGASISMLSQFNVETVLNELLDENDINVFMAVPTVYAKLLQHIRKKDFDIRNRLAGKIRLMVSGSAALPQPIFDEWQKKCGHTLLERYGMTEIGMALTNSLETKLRKPGFVGLPFPGVKARIVDPDAKDVLVEGDHELVKTVKAGSEGNFSGDLQIKGPSVFKEYYGRPEATAKEFTDDGWFKTGDTAQFIENSFKILGRSSVDIIKSGGFKISALHVERLLLEHPSIEDIAVVGVEDPVYGQKVGAVVVLSTNSETLTLDQLRGWCEKKMPKYLIPTQIKILPELPKNHMGKVNKKELLKLAFP